MLKQEMRAKGRIVGVFSGTGYDGSVQQSGTKITLSIVLLNVQDQFEEFPR